MSSERVTLLFLSTDQEIIQGREGENGGKLELCADLFLYFFSFKTALLQIRQGFNLLAF